MGNEQSSSSKTDDKKAKTVTSVGIGAGLITVSILCPPMGGVMATTYLGTGLTMRAVGNLTDNERLAEAGKVIQLGAEIGAVGNVATRAIQGSHTCGSCERISKAFK